MAITPQVIYPAREEKTADSAPRAVPLEELDALAQWMDNAFQIPGLKVRFGLDALLGLVPILGDALSLLVSLYVLGAASQYRLPRVTLVRMVLNIALDGLLGAVPFVGDVFDVFWKANQKNVALLRRHLAESPTEQRRARSADWVFVGLLSLGLLAFLAAVAALMFAAFSAVGRLVWG